MQFPCESLDPLTQLSGADLANKPGSCTGLQCEGELQCGLLEKEPCPSRLEVLERPRIKSPKFHSIPFRSILFSWLEAGDKLNTSV